MRLEPGDSFGRYTVEALLGEGGMGSVYSAVDTKLERRVALKLLRADPSSEGSTHARNEGAERLLREARAAAAIEHANAVAVHDVGEVGDTRYIAMELVVGRSLRTYVGDESIPIRRRIAWLIDVARALGAAHARGLVHRDVKPENVMIREDGAVKVLDFGIAWISGLDRTGGPSVSEWTEEGVDEWRATLTRDGVLVGTPRYMSPEQLNGREVDGRADQFALGVVAYELLAGTPPWPGDTISFSALLDVLDKEPEALRKRAPQISASVEEVVHRALQKAPDDRFRTMEDFVDALERTQVPAASGSTSGLPTRGSSLVAFALVAVAASGVAYGVYGARHRGPVAAGAAANARASTPIAADSAYQSPPYVVLWLEASKGITQANDAAGGVVRWADQSGNGNDALSEGLPPVLVPRAIHDRPAVHFEGGSHLIIADSSSLRLGTGDFTIEIIARHDREAASDVITGYLLTTGYGMLYGKTADPEPFEGVALMVNYPQPKASTKLGAQTSYYHYVISTSEGLNDNKAHLFGARRRNRDLEVRVDGTAESERDDASDDLSAPGRPAFIGAQQTTTGPIQQLRGDIAEIMLVRSPISDDYLAKLEAQMKSKYGL